MTVFLATLNQMAFLFSMILVGYILVKTHAVEAKSYGVLSKLESNVFIPALVTGTFLERFTVETLQTAWQLLIASVVVLVITVPIALVLSHMLSPKNAYLCNMYRYGLAFANFGFVGNAVVSALFPDQFLDYLIFTLPFWILIYVWGVPYLLMADGSKPTTLLARLKPFCNPMFIGMLLGIFFGLTQIPLPSFVTSLISSCGNCMSPIAMLLTGMVAAAIDLKSVLRRAGIYIATVLRLLVIPLATLGVLALLKLPENIAVCITCCVSMPLGLNTVVIPGGYGKDVSDAAGMAIVSHFAAIITIPFIFLLLEKIL